MISIIRRHQQTLMILVTIVIIICFVWLYDPTLRRGGGTHIDSVGQIYGRTISLDDAHRAGRKLQVCSDLGLMELIRSLVTDARDQNEQIANFAFNNIVLRHEADALGIAPTEEQYIEAVKALPIFQEDGGYSGAKFNEFVQRLAAFGFTEQLIEESVMDQLRLIRIKELIGATLAPVPVEVREAFSQLNQQTELSFVRITSSEFMASFQLPGGDIKKAFEERKDTLKTEEQRKVKYVGFLLDEEQKKAVEEGKLAGKEKGAIFQKLVDQAGEFAIAMTEKDATLEAVAEKFGATVKETPEFTLANPPEELAKSSAVASAAFKLTTEQPNSDPITTPNGYFVLHLADIVPPRPLTFEEAKPKLSAGLIEERLQEALQRKANESRARIAAALKEGKSFAEAAAAAGLTAEKLPAFSLAQPGKMDQPGARDLIGTSLNLSAGELSGVIPYAAGRLIAYVDRRLSIDEAAFEKEKPQLMGRLANYRTDSAFEVWLAERRKLADIRSLLGPQG